MRLLGDSGQIGSFVRGDLLLERSNSGGVGGFAGICGGLGLLLVRAVDKTPGLKQWFEE